MASFSYRALAPGGREEVQGRIDAASSAEVIVSLQRTGHTVLDVEAVTSRKSLTTLLATEVAFSRGLSDRDFLSLVREWATLLGAGLPIHTTLALSGRSSEAGRRAALSGQLLAALRNGRTLRDALAETRLFPPAFVALVGAAEVSGTLDRALARAAEEAETRAMVAQKLRKELIYPAFLTVTASAAIIVLLVVVVPGIETLIEDSPNLRLPMATIAVIALSHAVREYLLLGVLTIGAFAALLGLFARAKAGRMTLARLRIRLPVFGPAVLLTSLSTYTGALSALIAGGVGLARAQALAAETVTNVYIKRRLLDAGARIVEGSGLQPALQDISLLPEEALGLIGSGEQTGRLADMLSAASRLMRSRSDRILETAATLLGPTLTILFGLAAGLIVYAMLTTILSLNEFAFR